MAKWTKRNNPHTWGKSMAKAKRKTKSVAMSVSRPRRGGPLVVRETRVQVPRRRGRGGGGGTTSNRVRGGAFVGGFAWGYLKKNYSGVYAKIPAVRGSAMLTAAGVGHFLLKPRSGSWLDHAVTAAAVLAGNELAESGGIFGDDTDASWE